MLKINFFFEIAHSDLQNHDQSQETYLTNTMRELIILRKTKKLNKLFIIINSHFNSENIAKF